MSRSFQRFLQSRGKSWLLQPRLLVPALLVLMVVVLRLPSLTEPYWYGDEAIYLTIGNALNNGAILYQDIVDHKTPLIYFFAMVGSQLKFRLLMMAWMAVTTLSFFGLTTRLLRHQWLAVTGTVLFILLTSLPFLEGNIPNGELFVMGFVVSSLWLFVQTQAGREQLLEGSQQTQTRQPLTRKTAALLVAAGVLMGGAILTKVPALFDAAAIFYIGWLAGWDRLLHDGFKKVWTAWRHVLSSWLMLAAGLMVPLVGSVLYFMIRGAGRDYLNFGLLYNFHYVQTWTLGHLPGWGQTLLTFPVKLGLLAAVLVALTLAGRWVARPTRWAVGWLLLALFASILSNRPYPHYLLQVVPPLILSIMFVLKDLWAAYQQRSLLRHGFGPLIVGMGGVAIVWLVWSALRIGGYPVLPYYQTYAKLVFGQLTPVQYRDAFNPFLADTYAAATLISQSDDPKLFIWGTNPMLYALTKKQPVGRFTVAFHIHDLQVYDETLAAVRHDQPTFIVTMKNESTPLPGLDAYLTSHYRKRLVLEKMVVWKKRTL